MADSGVQLIIFLCLASLLVVLIMMFVGIVPSNSEEEQIEEGADNQGNERSGG